MVFIHFHHERMIEAFDTLTGGVDPLVDLLVPVAVDPQTDSSDSPPSCVRPLKNQRRISFLIS